MDARVDAEQHISDLTHIPIALKFKFWPSYFHSSVEIVPPFQNYPVSVLLSDF
ncbi:hypothetical protein MTR_4g089075 [Medicago truncatula]|uniref:Uncharacterized protein n=1 Tax=Medicago truncatula TaxID=3880 RepID=A0A072UMT9_MEDTR|nr:hypothetical protein MTR_4g089075 [Medicago truncatula]